MVIYKNISVAGCGSSEITSFPATVTSPKYPYYYDDNEFCTWSITGIRGTIVSLSWIVILDNQMS